MEKKINILIEDDFLHKSPDSLRKSQMDKISACFKDDIYKSTDDDRSEYSGPDTKQGFDNKSITEASNAYLHHKLMAGYHSVKADQLNDEGLKLAGATNEEVYNTAGDKKKEAKRHTMAADEHRAKAQSLHDEKEHGTWNKTIPSKAQAVKYGSKHAKAIDKKEGGKVATDKDYLEQKKTELKKGDISYKLQSGTEGMVFSKKGSEFKTLAQAKLAQLEERCASYITRMTKLKEHLEKEGVKFVCTTIKEEGIECWRPTYQWVQNPNDEQQIQQSKINEYNDLNWRGQDIRQDCKVLRTLIDNVEDNKSYNVNISQLSALEKSDKDTLSKGEDGSDSSDMEMEKGGRGSGRKEKETAVKHVGDMKVEELRTKAKELGVKNTGNITELRTRVLDAHVDKQIKDFKEKKLKKSEAFAALGIE